MVGRNNRTPENLRETAKILRKRGTYNATRAAISLEKEAAKLEKKAKVDRGEYSDVAKPIWK